MTQQTVWWPEDEAEWRNKLTDLDLVKKCAEKMGIDVNCWPSDNHEGGFYCKINRYDYYNPLTDDAQAMALVKHFKLDCEYGTLDSEWTVVHWESDSGPTRTVSDADLNRAIVRCVAGMP